MNEFTSRIKCVEIPVRQLRVELVRSPDGSTGSWTAEKLSIGSAATNDITLTDRAVSRYHLELSQAPGGVLIRDLGSTNGTWLGSVRVHEGLVAAGTSVIIGESELIVTDGPGANAEIHVNPRLDEIVGSSPSMRKLMAQIDRAAQSDVAILVQGESGTGKELVARALHTLGARKKQPFVVVDCGALDENLISSELFGHEKGSFTGAVKKHTGAFERANGGTLFLDEIGELPLNLQTNLLGALERRRARRIGGREEVPFDVRIVAATNRDLRQEINAGRFRLDLFYRVAVVRFELPPTVDPNEITEPGGTVARVTRNAPMRVPLVDAKSTSTTPAAERTSSA